VVPRLYEGSHAYILQNDDRRVVFMIPFEERFTLIGTTEVPLTGDPTSAQASDAEVEYLCRAASRYLAQPLEPSAVRWRFAGVRPLHDDGSHDPSAVTRDYTFRVDDEAGAAPALSVFGGKITTYRRLAEHALEKLAPYFPKAKRTWTERAPLPGSDFGGRKDAFESLGAHFPKLPGEVLRGVFRRHGALAPEVLGDGDLGEDYGAGLTEREVRYFVEREWATSAEDVLWRRSKAGLHMNEAQRRRVLEVMGR
jgi:glycerol-3-phosphate dehydrogenase